MLAVVAGWVLMPATRHVTQAQGAWWDEGAACWRFALYSAHATSVELQLFQRSDPRLPILSVSLGREGDVWHGRGKADELDGAELYGFRVDGPYELPGRDRFDRSKLLLDPYAQEVWFPPRHDRDVARVYGRDTGGRSPLAVLPSREPRAAVDGRRAVVAPHERVVMEVHVRGATMSSSSPVAPAARGTFAGLREVLDEWAALGVTTIELLPVHQFDPKERNYWGYMPLVFGAVHRQYATSADAAGELGELVLAAHVRGIEVWLDVVFNHTTEEDEHGPTLSLRGIDRASYYLLRADGTDVDDAGCGNVLRAGHPAATALVLESLDRFADLGVDGFRFDLASLLARDPDGNGELPPAGSSAGAVPAITEWARGRGVRLVAEAWDLGRYELGDAFAGRSWAQWNGKFRDDVRSFLRGEDGFAESFAQRVQGSPDLFGPLPWRSINFVTAHDGFTLYDLYAYDRKHNEANGNGGTDGTDDNRSWNCGVEGDHGVTSEVLELRYRMIRNALCVLMLSAGTPMFVAGDEFAQTQGGNNNPYNQDTPTTWLDWRRAEDHKDLRRFLTLLIALRRATPSIGRRVAWGRDVQFFGVDGSPDLGPHSHSLAWWLRGGADRCDDVCVIVNAFWEPLTFPLPPAESRRWQRAIDTSLPSPDDIVERDDRVDVGEAYTAGPRSVVVLTRRNLLSA